MKLYRQAGNIKAALFVGGVALMAGLLLYTQSIIEDLRQESRETVSLYAQLIAKGVTDANDTELDFVFREIIQKVKFPVIYSDQEGTPVNWRNLPIQGDGEVEMLTRVMRDMDSQNRPIPLIIRVESPETQEATELVLGHLHYGDSTLIRQLRLLPYIEIGAVALFVFLGFAGFQIIRKNEKQHIWFGMARETAHQLGTPVSSLMGWLERIRQHPEKTEHASDQMAGDVARLEQISDRFARMGSSPKLQTINIRELMSDTVEYYKRRIPQTGRDISLTLQDGDPLFVNGTPTLLSWALENIVKNAIDSIDKTRGGEVSLSATLEDGDVVVLVSDTGKGIPRRDWKNIFRPGYSTKERGWGLGLSLAKRIIEEFQNGRVRVMRSEVGKGTSFEIRLPKQATDQEKKLTLS